MRTIKQLLRNIRGWLKWRNLLPPCMAGTDLTVVYACTVARNYDEAVQANKTMKLPESTF